MKRNFKIDLNTGIAVLCGVKFKICDKDFDGYSPIKRVAEKLDIGIVEIENVLKKYRIMNDDGTRCDDYPEKFTGHDGIMERDPVLFVLVDTTAGILCGEEFIEGLLKIDKINYALELESTMVNRKAKEWANYLNKVLPFKKKFSKLCADNGVESSFMNDSDLIGIFLKRESELSEDQQWEKFMEDHGKQYIDIFSREDEKQKGGLMGKFKELDDFKCFSPSIVRDYNDNVVGVIFTTNNLKNLVDSVEYGVISEINEGKKTISHDVVEMHFKYLEGGMHR